MREALDAKLNIKEQLETFLGISLGDRVVTYSDFQKLNAKVEQLRMETEEGIRKEWVRMSPLNLLVEDLLVRDEIGEYLYTRLSRALRAEGIIYLGQLVTRRQGRLPNTPSYIEGIGEKGLDVLRHMLAKYNLRFGMCELRNTWQPPQD